MMKKFVAACIVSLMLAGCVSPEAEPHDFHGEDFEERIYVEDFSLMSSNNTTWNFTEQTYGKVSIAVFLFTNCLDICPIVSQNVRWIQANANHSDMLEIFTITVDPWRDNATTLQEWQDWQDSHWTHLTIEDVDNESQMENIASIWTQFGVGLEIQQANTSTESNTSQDDNSSENSTESRHHGLDYLVEHSTGTIFIDHTGHQRVWWGDEDWVLDLALEDINYLLEEAHEAYLMSFI